MLPAGLSLGSTLSQARFGGTEICRRTVSGHVPRLRRIPASSRCAVPMDGPGGRAKPERCLATGPNYHSAGGIRAHLSTIRCAACGEGAYGGRWGDRGWREVTAMATGSGDDECVWDAEKRDFVADRRDEIADERDAASDARDGASDAREAE